MASMPSKAQLCLLGESLSSGSPGKAPDTECCASVGNNAAKRTQGGHGLQCDNVKGLSL